MSLESGRGGRVVFLLLISFFFLSFPGFSCAADSLGFSNGTRDFDSPTGVYIVRLQSPPLVARFGRSMAAVAKMRGKAKGSHFLAENPGVKEYRARLTEERQAVLQNLRQKVRKSCNPLYIYDVVLNGMALQLSREEAAAVRRLPGVVAVDPESLLEPASDAGPQWIGAATIWNGVGPFLPAKGEGLVIGVIDTGITPENSSFADLGDDGYDHKNPFGAGFYFGVCNPSSSDYDPSFPCNDKLIGAYDMTATSGTDHTARDKDGHGSHVAGTAAGNVVYDAAIDAPTTTVQRDISGVAPHANIISYKVCSPGCTSAAVIAAINQAVIDQVDVIVNSLGSGAQDPWQNPESLALLNARKAGVVVVTSAGNGGPDAATIASPADAPWVLAAGAASHNRIFANKIFDITDSSGSSGLEFFGQSLTGSLGSASLVYAGDYGDALALAPFAAGTFAHHEIVICDRGQSSRISKGVNVAAGGAGGLILVNSSAQDHSDSIQADPHVIPAVHLNYLDGLDLKNWLANSQDARAEIGGTTVKLDEAWGDCLYFLSARGPNPHCQDVIKPDLVAPGAAIMAASKEAGKKAEVRYGTSMAAAHVGGAALLMKELYKGAATLTPAEIQSALMLTAVNPVTDIPGAATPEADPLARGSGRIDLAKAAATALVMPLDTDDFEAANPAVGGDPTTLNLPALAAAEAVTRQVWRRRFRNLADHDIQWALSVTAPPGCGAEVFPSVATLGPGKFLDIKVQVDLSLAEFDRWLFGQVLLVPDDSNVSTLHLPIAIRSRNSTLPDIFTLQSGLKGTQQEGDFKAIAISDLYTCCSGLVAGVCEGFAIVQNPTRGKIDFTSEPDPLQDGVFKKEVVVVSGCRRLVAEITGATAPDVDVYIYDSADLSKPVAESTSSGSKERCSLVDPAAGTYWIFVDNYQATDSSGVEPDYVNLVWAVVPGDCRSNFSVAFSDGTTSKPAGEPFKLDIDWDVSSVYPSANRWYGIVDFGTSSSSPDDLKTVPVDLISCTNGCVRRESDGTIYDLPLQYVYDKIVSDGDTLQLRALDFAESLVFDRNLAVKLVGGYLCDFSSHPGKTATGDSLEVSGGCVTVENLVVGGRSE